MLPLLLGRLVPQCHWINFHKLPQVSLLLIVCAPILLSLPWYLLISPMLDKNRALQSQWQAHQAKQDTQIEQVKREHKARDSKQSERSQYAWLNAYSWLNWQLNTTKQPINHVEVTGVATFTQWQKVLTNLDQQALIPVTYQLRWLPDNRLKLALVLRPSLDRVTTASIQLISPIRALLTRPYKAWPDDLSLTATLYWQQQRFATLQLGGQKISVLEGVWVPEIAANLISLNHNGALFRQQYLDQKNETSNDASSQEKLLTLTKPHKLKQNHKARSAE